MCLEWGRGGRGDWVRLEAGETRCVGDGGRRLGVSSLGPRLAPLKNEGGVSLVTSAAKVVDFRRQPQAVPIRLQNEIT